MPGGVDHAALFDATSTPFVVLDPELVVVEANPAYLAVTGRSRESVVGRRLLDAFPPNPAEVAGDGLPAVSRSFDRVVETGLPDTLPPFRHDLRHHDGTFTERYWSAVTVPVHAGGRLAMLLHRVDDVTEYVRERGAADGSLRRRVRETEADLYSRARELRAALDAEGQARRRLATLADVALELAGARTVRDLTDIVIVHGLAALDADGGAVGTVVDGRLCLGTSDSLSDQVQRRYAEIPLDGPLPACAAARGERVVLPDRAASLGFGDAMAGVLADTGLDAWASLPLRIGERVLGSLTVGWRAAQQFGPDTLTLLDALAAQCAQTLDRIRIRQAEQETSLAVRRLSEALQHSLLTAPPELDDLQIAVRYQPAAEEAQVGGDWYDAFHTDGGTALVIGDVAGHDGDAAAVMGQLRNLLRGIAHATAAPPAAVLAELDRAMAGLGVAALATVLLVRVEPVGCGRRLLRWSSAGHPPPLVVAADGTTEVLWSRPDLLLGVMPTAARHEHVRLLEPGETVLLYTDGLVERRGIVIDEGLEHLVRTARPLAGHDLDEFCDVILARLPAVVDDVALLAVRAAAPGG